MTIDETASPSPDGLPQETPFERELDREQEGTDRDYERRWWTLGVLCLSLVMIVMANASLNVALPTLAESLHTGASGLQWIVDAYSLVFAGLLLTAGSLGDRYGRRLALNGGLVVFGLASLAAVVSDSAGAVIACRAVMGVGAAFVMPATLSILAHVFPPDERPRAIAIWAGFAGVGVAAGGVVSGALLEHFWWGSIFLINVFVVVVALVAGFFLIPRSREKIHAPLDPLGAVLSIAGLAALVYGIIEAPDKGWTSTQTLVTFALAIVVLVAFVVWELRADEPMLDLGYFRNPRFTAATTAITLVFFAMFGSYFLFTQYLQFVHGYSPLSAGIRILPWALAYLLSATQSAKLVERFGQRAVVASGLTIAGLGGALLAVTSSVDASYWWFALAVVVQALGMGITTAPSTGAIMRSLPLHKAGVGSAVNDTTRELGGALGVAVMGSLVASQFRSSMESTLQNAPATPRTPWPRPCGPRRRRAGRRAPRSRPPPATASSTPSAPPCGSPSGSPWSPPRWSPGSCARRPRPGPTPWWRPRPKPRRRPRWRAPPDPRPPGRPSVRSPAWRT